MASGGEGRTLGWVLVAVQGVLFAAVAVFALGPDVGPRVGGSPLVGAAIVAVGSAVFVAAAAHLGRALTPHPEPNLTGLAARGVYRYARHPMYTALIVMATGVAVATGLLASYATAAAIVVLFEVKSRVEERYLLGAYDGYAAYARDTGKFIPGVGRRRA